MIKTIPIEAERYQRLKEDGYTRDSIFEDGRHEDLKALLFRHGGEAAILAFKDEDKEKIMSRGVFASGEGSLLRRGNDGACHYNAAMNFKNGSCGIMTGYALSDDGVWRMHTWNIGADGTIIETTEERVAYFGFVLTQQEGEVFLSENDFYVDLKTMLLDETDEEEWPVGDFVVYNNPDTVGEIIKENPLSVFTSKKVSEDVIGDRVWLITAAGKPRTYFLKSCFIIDCVDSGMKKGFRTCISGTEGEVFDPMVPIEDEQWFRDFKKSMANFSIGFSSIKNPDTVLNFQRLVDNYK